MANRTTGFTLVETLVVVAILGLLAAISIPLTINSINRSKQAQSMANIRAIAVAWEMRNADVKAYNAAGATYRLPTITVTATNLATILSPTYIRAIPTRDGWNTPLDFLSDAQIGSRTAQAKTYAIRSRGRDKVLAGTGRTYTIGATTNFDCDIVYSQGAFQVYPEGKQNAK